MAAGRGVLQRGPRVTVKLVEQGRKDVGGDPSGRSASDAYLLRVVYLSDVLQPDMVVCLRCRHASQIVRSYGRCDFGWSIADGRRSHAYVIPIDPDQKGMLDSGPAYTRLLILTSPAVRWLTQGLEVRYFCLPRSSNRLYLVLTNEV
jgi:hypothetical protein